MQYRIRPHTLEAVLDATGTLGMEHEIQNGWVVFEVDDLEHHAVIKRLEAQRMPGEKDDELFQSLLCRKASRARSN